MATRELENTQSASRAGHTGAWFWVVVFAFTTTMAFTTVPAPLWSLFAQRDGFSSFMVTVVFAVYALAVALSLFLVGHVSDWYGRRRVLMPAIALEIIAGVVFVIWPSLPGLLLARVLSGLGIGAVTATATAWLAELRGVRDRHTQAVATSANLGGLGLGALVSGFLAQWASPQLRVPFLVFTVALFVAWVALLGATETRRRGNPLPHYRPQRIEVPRASRARFFAAALAAAITFAIFGLLASLTSLVLEGTFHQPSLLLSGAVTFIVFAAAALIQTLTSSRSTQHLLAAAIPTMLAGLGLLTVAVWLPSPSFSVFLLGVIVVGAGSGLMFEGAVSTITEISAPEHRAEALAGMFLACYLGLSIPVIGLGALTQFASIRVSLLVFAAVLGLGILAAAPTLLGRRADLKSAPPQPASS
jgi:MFS family permease